MRDAVQVFSVDSADDYEEPALDWVPAANPIAVDTTTAQLTDHRSARRINLGFTIFDLNATVLAAQANY